MSEMNKIVFTDDVQLVIDQIIQSNDPLESPNFNPTDYVNQMFQTEQSLSNIDAVIAQTKDEVKTIDDKIRSIVRDQGNTGHDGRVALKDAQKVIKELFSQITDIKTRAESTEDMVKEITHDIKQLDCAKRNLTSAITTLNHLHMLVGGVETLTILTERRLYGELLNPLQAITEVNQHFQQFSNIPQIKQLSLKVEKIHKQLAEQITEDFYTVFAIPLPINTAATGMDKSSAGNATRTSTIPKTSLSQISEACLVVSVMDEKVKRDLLKVFIAKQLEEYLQLFHENQDIAWLDKIDKRYAWLKRHLIHFEDKFERIFPNDWEISERIAAQFCLLTQDALMKIMSKRRQEIDVKLLLYAISKTVNFELLLAKRFTGITFNEIPSTGQISTLSGIPPVATVSPFINLIGSCFKHFLDIYTDSIDGNLSEIMERIVQDSRQKYDPVRNNSTVYPSSADLFVFYKKCMVQCTELSNDKPMYDLTLIFKKYLREYAVNILETKIPKMPTTLPTTSIGSSITIHNLSTAAGQVIHNFLKEGELSRFTRDEHIKLCCILTTADYCLETVLQLETKLKEKINRKFVERIDLSDEKDMFHRIISNCINLLVTDLENGCESSLHVMSKMQWQSIKYVGDQSIFINSLIQHFKQTVPQLRDNLNVSRKYFAQICHKFVNSFMPKYINTLYKCRPSNIQQDGTNNVLGCEQLLLDTHSLKTVLLDLPSIGTAVKRKAPATYTKVVVNGMTKAEMIIKMVMTSDQSAAEFIKKMFQCLPDITLQEFHKILDMKSLRHGDRIHLIDLFKSNMAAGLKTGVSGDERVKSCVSDGGQQNVNDVEPVATSDEANSNNSGTTINVSSPSGGYPSDDKARFRKLEKLIRKRLLI